MNISPQLRLIEVINSTFNGYIASCTFNTDQKVYALISSDFEGTNSGNNAFKLSLHLKALPQRVNSLSSHVSNAIHVALDQLPTGPDAFFNLQIDILESGILLNATQAGGGGNVLTQEEVEGDSMPIV
ncbi:MAG: hypothetical protein ACFB10_18960 [Salibacteraceae bacterium]